MKLLYIANIRLPTEKAHGIQIMEMCAAFVDQGLSVELVVPIRSNFIKEDPFEYHDTRRIFTIRKLPSLNPLSLGRAGYLLGIFTFTVSVIASAAFEKPALYYTRDEFIALCLHLIGKQVAWEGHTGQQNVITRWLLRLRVPIVVITDALRELYLSHGAEPMKVIVAPDGADITRFNIPVSQIEARERLGLPRDKKIVLYKGHLYEMKGAHTLARAAAFLKEEVVCVFIGGSDVDVAAFKHEFGQQKNVLILGNKPRKETPVYQKAADLLVIPNSAKDDVSKLYTSPMKLFGYMASGVPIVASDLPSLHEIVDDAMAYFFTPDDPQSLAAAITHALGEYDDAKRKGEHSLSVAEQYSWQKRAKSILDFMEQNA